MLPKLFLIVLSLIISITGFISCSKSGGGGGTGGGGGGGGVNCTSVSNKAFAADVNPIIQGRCALPACHDAGSTNGVGPLTNYTQVFNARSRIRSAVSSGSMPQGSTLSADQKNSITCWIDGGAPNN